MRVARLLEGSEDLLIDNRSEPMSDGDERRTSRKRLLERRRDPRIHLVVNATSGFVHDDDLGTF